MQVFCSNDSTINYKQLIKSYQDANGRIDRVNIKKIIPYGEDFIFLDCIDSITDNSIHGYFTVPFDQPYIKAHFTHTPIMPGCLIAESFAQAGTILIRHCLGISKPINIFVGRIETAKFTAIVSPRQTIKHKVCLQNINSNLGVARLQGDSFVEEKSVASFSVVLSISNCE